MDTTSKLIVTAALIAAAIIGVIIQAYGIDPELFWGLS